jgi:hypothetical protein
MRGIDRGGQRYFFNGRVFWVDPDPVYVRITDAGAKTVCSYVAVTGFMHTTSEQYEKLTAAQVDIIKRTIPHHGLTTARPADYYDRANPGIWLLTDTTKSGIRRDVIGVFNFDSVTAFAQNYSLDKLGLMSSKRYVGFDFWGDKFVAPFTGTFNFLLAPKACKVVAVREATDYPQVVSTSRHVTQGITCITEEKWDAAGKVLRGTSKLVRNDPYELRIVAMNQSGSWTAQSAAVSAEDQTAGVTVQPVVQNNTEVRVRMVSPVNRDVKWSVTFN